jgi:magnesium transporter
MNINKKLPSFSSFNIGVSPVALADILFQKDKRTKLFLELEPEKRIAMLRSVTTTVRKDLLRRLPDEDIVGMLQTLSPTDATDLLQQLGKTKRNNVLGMLSQELKDSLSTLLAFDPETAAGLMNLDYIQVETTENIEATAKKFMRHEQQTGRPPIIIVMQDGKPTGTLPGHRLGLAAKSELIGKYSKKLLTVSYAAKHRDVVNLFQSNPHNRVAVLNDKNEVVGIIYSDDMLKILQNDQASSLYNFAGIVQSESVTDSAKSKVQNRYRWLIINLATAFLAAFTVGRFEAVLSQYVLLAVYMPIVAGMGGNAATQTLAVLVRGIALRQIELKTALKTLRSELGAGLMNGLINGVLVAAVVLVINRDIKIAIILALAMVINLIVASVFGTIVPLIMQKFGKDPATSATIFITTATDILGFMAFLGLATIILN